MQAIRLLTIGVYGFTEDSFFTTLQRAGVDLLVDVRSRRGVRGSEYAFANSQRLQARLAELGIAYRHHPEMAPCLETRQQQLQEDRRAGMGQRSRTAVSERFNATYQEEQLSKLNVEAFLDSLGEDVHAICFLCVEREPEACHRSALAAHIGAAIGAPVEHLMP